MYHLNEPHLIKVYDSSTQFGDKTTGICIETQSSPIVRLTVTLL